MLSIADRCNQTGSYAVRRKAQSRDHVFGDAYRNIPAAFRPSGTTLGRPVVRPLGRALSSEAGPYGPIDGFQQPRATQTPVWNCLRLHKR